MSEGSSSAANKSDGSTTAPLPPPHTKTTTAHRFPFASIPQVLAGHCTTDYGDIIQTPIALQDSTQSDTATPSGAPPGLYHRLTNNSLRQSVRDGIREGINKQKYAKYGQDRYHVEEADENQSYLDEDLVNAPQRGQAATAAQKGYLERAQSKAKALMKRKRTLGKGDVQDTVVDVLYENQRGYFAFGIPKYSSATLMPFDAKPWQNGQFRTSAVDIRNAQVPDPSWEWAWKSWYVDMSRDVDEEGWEYSFAFAGKEASTFAWHGNHPWFHSFVRRRRWLRMRRRKAQKHQTKEKSHELTAEYFTIHPKTVRPTSLSDSQIGSSTLVALARLKDPVLDIENMEISSIGDLFLALRKANVDREKILSVKKFIDEGGEELFYLGERMGDIMGTFMFQSSRRQLLADLISRHEEAHKTQKDLDTHQHEDDDTKQQEHDRAARRASSLLKAVHAAEEQVKKLEYWSDIKEVGDAAAAAEKEEGHSEPSFKNKQAAKDGAPTLNGHQDPPKTLGDTGHETAYETASDVASRKSSKFVDAPSEKSRNSDTAIDDDDELERYTTASEHSSEISSKKNKGKGKAKALDGVAEEEDESEQLISPATGARGKRRSVQIVEPVPESSDDEDEDGYAFAASSPPDRENVKTPDSVANLMRTMRQPKSGFDLAFG